ncbi:DNA-directed RNA polymerases I and III subunit RPAC2 [Nosema granulosis]|uniref:DNA-directed RNA polymerases I and III subunit RPAC2 n=1 Tax=Nosema granulosis TaxID=83296 RepID=A0A9P6KY25_9MICR|nr:DNA-directed RNA polymerases I and III subunit RPAC2 [Nosema granulosis]
MEEEHRVKIINELSLNIRKEDHTIMNPIRYAIQSDFLKEGVEFCGYTIPHPSEQSCNLVIQMKDKEKQTLENLIGVTCRGIDNLVSIIDKISKSLDNSL